MAKWSPSNRPQKDVIRTLALSGYQQKHAAIFLPGWSDDLKISGLCIRRGLDLTELAPAITSMDLTKPLYCAERDRLLFPKIKNPTINKMEAHVYAIRRPDGARCYVGSTLGKLAERLTRHKWRAATGERPHSRIHNLMAQEGPENFTIEHLETVPVAARIETEARHIRTHGTCNMVIPGRSRAQYREELRSVRRHLATLTADAVLRALVVAQPED